MTAEEVAARKAKAPGVFNSFSNVWGNKTLGPAVTGRVYETFVRHILMSAMLLIPGTALKHSCTPTACGTFWCAPGRSPHAGGHPRRVRQRVARAEVDQAQVAVAWACHADAR